MTGSFRRVHFDKHKNIQNDDIKIQQTSRQTSRHKYWGRKGGHLAPKIQPTGLNSLLKYFLLQCMMQYYCKSSAETLTTEYGQLIFNILFEDVHSQLWGCQAVGANH